MKKDSKVTSGQFDRFKKAAKDLGCDESEAAFDEKLKALTKQEAAETEKTSK